MTTTSPASPWRTLPGRASAEEGLVILDGPDGIAVTMTAYAASETGKSLLEAAKAAEEQARNSSSHSD